MSGLSPPRTRRVLRTRPLRQVFAVSARFKLGNSAKLLGKPKEMTASEMSNSPSDRPTRHLSGLMPFFQKRSAHFHGQ